MEAHLLTPQQVARRLQITLNTTYAWLREGRILGVRMGRRWRVRPEALEQFLAARESTRAPAAPAGSEETIGEALMRILDEATAGVPADAWPAFPRDGAVNHDHYLYGTTDRRHR